jgi:2-haloacid dehalogenase
MARTIIFDVNETLLDMSALDPHFARVFGDASVREPWFAQVLRSALVATILGQYVNFGSIAGMALDMIAMRRGVDLAADDREAILAAMLALPAHPDVPGALARLREAGFRLAALTNTAQKAAETQLAGAGLDGHFDAILSVDAVRRFKPAPEVYEMAAARLAEQRDRLRLVTAHDWDIAGALNAGWRAAFVARAGMVIAPQAKSPDILGDDMTEVTEQILQLDLSA